MTKNSTKISYKPSILFLVPTDYASLVAKGVVHMILERDEHGFFEQVITVHPNASQTQTLHLNEIHRVIELGPAFPFPLRRPGLGGKVVPAVLRYLRHIFVIFFLVRLIRRERIDLIRSNDPYKCGFYAWAASTLTGIPFCVSVHADYEKNYHMLGQNAPWVDRYLEKWVLDKADLIMPISDYLGSLLINRGVAAKEKIRVIPHGIAAEVYLTPKDLDLWREFHIPNDKKFITMVARLSKEKFVYDALEVAQRLSKIRDDFMLIFVGDGRERANLDFQIADKNLQDRVRLLGFQSNEHVAAILQKSHVSLCLLAGFVLIESCLCATPTICYDIEWHRELIANGETGILVDEGDLDALTTAVEYLFAHPDEAHAMGKRARMVALTKHEISRTSAIKVLYYQQML